jgi:branched-chain amino acid transport system ATP-binding protein
MSAILSIRNLTAGYGKLPVLHDISLDLDAGRMLAVIGPNGAGKSSLTRAIVNLCTIMSGSVSFDGQDITRLPTEAVAARGLGYVPQTRNVFRALSVQENLEMSSLLLDRAAQARAIDAA